MKWPVFRKDAPPPRPPYLNPPKDPAITELKKQTYDAHARIERSTTDLMRLYAEIERRKDEER